MPLDLCVEMILWDRFHWGPEQTERMSLRKMRELFAVLEQQRVSRDAIQNLGPPTVERHKQLLAQRHSEQEAKKQ